MEKTLKIIFLILIIFGLCAICIQAEAASATISASKTEAKVGDSVKVTVSIDAATWNLKVTGSASDSIVGYNSDAENEKTTKTYTIDTSKAGTYTVTLSGDVTDGTTEQNTDINKSVTIKVTEKEATAQTTTTTTEKEVTKSSNANLKTLGVTPKEYDFTGFSKNKTSYSVTIPSTVNSLKVAYKTEDAKATVKITGNSGFEVGSANVIKVVVTAEDKKTTKTYEIKVTKLATEDEKPGNLIEEETTQPKLYLTMLRIEGVVLSPEFSSDVFTYRAVLNKDLSELKIEGTANDKNAKIETSGNTNLQEGENLVNVILTGEDGTKTIYQITIVKDLTAEVEEENEREEIVDSDNILTIGKKAIKIIIIAVVVIILLIALIIILLVGENKRLNGTEEEYSKPQNLNDIPRKEEDSNKGQRKSGRHF